jgi:hypothetical protein
VIRFQRIYPGLIPQSGLIFSGTFGSVPVIVGVDASLKRACFEITSSQRWLGAYSLYHFRSFSFSPKCVCPSNPPPSPSSQRNLKSYFCGIDVKRLSKYHSLSGEKKGILILMNDEPLLSFQYYIFLMFVMDSLWYGTNT